MSETTNSTEVFDAVAALTDILADSDGAPRETGRSRDRKSEGVEPEAQDETSDETPDDADEVDADADEDSTADEDGSDGDLDEGDEADSDGAPRDDADEKEAEKDRLRYADYTRKSQALAEERRSFQAEQEAVRQERAQYAVLLDQLSAQVAEVPLPTLEQMNELRASNPQAYLLAKDEITSLIHRRDAIKQEQQRIEYEAAVQEAENFKAAVATEMELLLQKRPEWHDQKVFAKVQRELRQFGRDVMGFSEEELNHAADHRAILALADAMETHKLKKIKAEPARSSAKTIQPGSSSASPRKTNALDEAIKRQSRGGSISSTADVLRHLI